MHQESTHTLSGHYPSKAVQGLVGQMPGMGIECKTSSKVGSTMQGVALRGPLSGLAPRDGGAGGVLRRPSWSSSRSSVFEAAPVGTLGYSISPLHNSLESSLVGGSTPRHALAFPRSLTSPTSPSMTGPVLAVGKVACSALCADL